jgi:nucleotide-binding universal stress UspA family protein
MPMTIKLLIPVDGSEGAMRAVKYAADTFKQIPAVKMTLLHILPELPPSMWDDGHILTEAERRDRDAAIADWEDKEEKPWEDILHEARDQLIHGGIPAEAVSIKYQPTYSDVADDILDEAELEGCSTIVIGRHGTSGARKLFLGSVSNKVVNHAKGVAVIIVDHGESEESPEAKARRIKERRLLRAKVKGQRPGCLERLINFSKYW